MAYSLRLNTLNQTITVPPVCVLERVIVTNPLALAVVTVYNGDEITDPIITVISCSLTVASLDIGLPCPSGFTAKLTGAAAEVLVIYS